MIQKKKAVKVIKKAWTVKDIVSNTIWFLVGGLWLGVLFSVFGLLLCITVVGVPRGKDCFRAALVAMFPYGKKVSLHINAHYVANMIWAVTVGWILALVFFATGVACILTIIGFFRGIQVFKLMRLALFPFGMEVEKRFR